MPESTTGRRAIATQRWRTVAASLALIGMTASWGSTFYLIKDLLVRLPTLDFLAVRFSVASLFLLVVAPRSLGRLTASSRRHAIILGLLYGCAQTLQTAGLAHTSASVSGFVTGLYVVLTPLLAAVLLRSRIPWVTWGAVALAVTGLAVLTLHGLAIGVGELLTLASAVLYALHIVGLGTWSRSDQALGMSLVQIMVIAAVCLVASVPDGVTLPHRTDDWLAVLYMAVVAGALAMLGQTWAQSQMTPTRAAIIMTMEPVFAALFAVLLGGEQFTNRMLFGGGLVLAAMVLVELPPRRKVEAEVTHIAV